MENDKTAASRRQRPVAAGSVRRFAALERRDRATVVGVPGELHVRVVGDPNEEAEKGAITLGLDGGDAGYELVLERESGIAASLLEF